MDRVRKAQEETQGLLMRCEVADESVVVMKSRPVKAGNSVEGKTGMTCRLVDRGRCEPKAAAECEGRKFIRRSLRNC
jgi:predicted transcriptional regulator